MNRNGLVRVGQLIMTGTLVGVVILMYAPNFIVAYQYRTIAAGDEIFVCNNNTCGDLFRVLQCEKDRLQIQSIANGQIKWIDKNLHIIER